MMALINSDRAEYITSQDAAQMLKVTNRTIINYIREGKLDGYAVSPRKHLVRMDSLEQMMAR